MTMTSSPGRRRGPNLIEEAAEDARLEREAIQWVESLPSLLFPPEPVLTPANWEAALEQARNDYPAPPPDPQGRLFR